MFTGCGRGTTSGYPREGAESRRGSVVVHGVLVNPFRGSARPPNVFGASINRSKGDLVDVRKLSFQSIRPPCAMRDDITRNNVPTGVSIHFKARVHTLEGVDSISGGRAADHLRALMFKTF